MSRKIYEITFKNHTSVSDFACKDGELENHHLGMSGNYPDSSTNLPVPDIDFALVRDTLKGWHLTPDSFPSKSVAGTQSDMQYWTKMASQTLSQFQNDAKNRNLFVAPVKIIAAWKTIYGGYFTPSPPLTLVPNSEVPLVGSDTDVTDTDMTLKIAAAVCSLRIRMRTSELLRDWVGTIDSLEILVSEPLINYDSYSAFIPSRKMTSDNYCRSLDLTTGEIADRRVCTVTLPLAWKANENVKLTEDGNIFDIKFYPFANIPLKEVDRADVWCRPEEIGGSLYGYTDSGLSYKEIIEGRTTATKSEDVIIEGKGESIDIITRPIKLSGGGKFKRVSRIFLRGNYTPQNITIRVYGSRDMLKWWCISRREGGTMVVLPRSAFRFYKVGITGMLQQGETLEGLAVEDTNY